MGVFSEFFRSLQSSLRWIDVLDILLVAFFVYRLLLLIRGTRAMQMLTGLGVLGIAFFLSSSLEIFTTHWLLSYFFDYLFLLIIVLFQDDLRRALATVGKNPFFNKAAAEEEIEMIEEIARAATRLAEEHTGALIVIERETGLKNFTDTGSRIDARVRSELIYSVFNLDSPMHDGAIIVSEGRIVAAGCFLPLSKDPNVDKKYGSRHRAALGITEDTDALVVLVSEEMGQVHLARDGKLTLDLKENELKAALATLMDLKRVGSSGFSFKNAIFGGKR